MQESIPSKKPYLLRAIYEWCNDNGYTPHIAVRVDARTRVPRQFMQHSEVVLNISFEATHQLKMSNEWIEFNARFSNSTYKISVPVDNVLAIYAYENGQGMAFPLEHTVSPQAGEDSVLQSSFEQSANEGSDADKLPDKVQADSSSQPQGTPKKGRGHLKLVK